MTPRMIDWAYWRSAVSDGRATFLVGAGVSTDAPSNLPLAPGLVSAVVARSGEALNLPAPVRVRLGRATHSLRPEVVTDVLAEYLGWRALQPLMVLSGRHPNGWHHGLAWALGRGCHVMTTNFDTLIESACQIAQVRPSNGPTGMRNASAKTSTRRTGSLTKLHGSLDTSATAQSLRTLRLAVGQVGLGLPPRLFRKVRTLISDRPLIVIGYAGRDDFDLAPVLLALERRAPTLWLLHDPRVRSLAALRGAQWRRRDAAPLRRLRDRWPSAPLVVLGSARRAQGLLGLANREPARRLHAIAAAKTRAPLAAPRDSHRYLHGLALVYLLAHSRSFRLARTVLRLSWPPVSSTPVGNARFAIAHALLAEKEARDLRLAERLASEACKVALHASAQTRNHTIVVQALDQVGVVARRRGKYKRADNYYARALRAAHTFACPRWLVVQVMAHRAVVLDYRKRYVLAMRYHRHVMDFERRHGDLRGLAMSHNNIALVYQSLRRWDAARDHLGRSLALKADLGDDRGTAQSLHNLGHIEYLAGNLTDAETAFARSLVLYSGRARDPHGAALSQIGLATLAKRRGHRSRALFLALPARDVFRANKDPRNLRSATALLQRLQDQRPSKISGRTSNVQRRRHEV